MATNKTVDGEAACRARRGIDQVDAGDAERHVGPLDRADFGIPDHLDLRVGEQPRLVGPVGAQPVATVDQIDLGSEIGQEQRLLDRGVAPADDRHRLAPEEESVARRARRHAKPSEPCFRIEAEPARLRPGRDDETVGDVAGAAVERHDEGPPRQIDRRDDVGDDRHPDVARLFGHADHQVGAEDADVARPVLDVGRDRQLAAGLEPLDEDGVERGAGGVDRRGIAGRARAEDENPGCNVSHPRYLARSVPGATNCRRGETFR